MGLAGVLRSELNETATRFDRLSAAPSSDEQVLIWITWSALAGFVGIVTSVFFIAILASPKARCRPFNVYVLFITFPGILFSAACSITCGLNAAKGRYVSEQMCSFQSWYVVFGFSSIAWMNAVVVRQVHLMLWRSSKHIRYSPPGPKTVCFHAAAVYLYSAGVASLTLLRTPIHCHADARGLACLPLEFDVSSSLFFWLCFFWLMIGVPLAYVVYVWFDIRRSKLMPPGGRTKSIEIFFRILLVFVGMWLPTIVSIYLAGAIYGPWLAFAGGTLSHLQPLASAWVLMAKHDIREAVFHFIRCSLRLVWVRATLGSRRSRSRMTVESDDDDAILAEVFTSEEGEQEVNRGEQSDNFSDSF